MRRYLILALAFLFIATMAFADGTDYVLTAERMTIALENGTSVTVQKGEALPKETSEALISKLLELKIIKKKEVQK